MQLHVSAERYERVLVRQGMRFEIDLNTRNFRYMASPFRTCAQANTGIYCVNKALSVVFLGCLYLCAVNAGLLASSSLEKCVRTERVRR